jgi:hypothetical protein
LPSDKSATESAKEWALENNVTYLETSSYSNLGILELKNILMSKYL